uniref:Uncharacterized protein n=1 Tax=Setaria italica TaxID=4555 RepID=K4AMH3_SETIT
MTLYSGKELKLIPLVLASLLLLMQFQSRGGLLRGRRLLMGRHGEAIFAKGLMEPVVAKEGGGALREEDKREVITGPNPLHNRR